MSACNFALGGAVQLDGNLSFISASIEGSVPENTASWQACSRFLEIALGLVRLDHIASRIVNANHGIM